MSEAPRFEYAGDEALRPALEKALRKVVDPEMALGIVELGLVYRVEATPGAAKATITMTSPACPVVEVIVADVQDQLASVVGDAADVHVDVVWDPPWGPERMSDKARNAMGW